MARIVGSAEISATQEAIWDLMCDLHRLPEFVDSVDRMITVPDGDMGLGCTYRTYEGIEPFKAEVEWRVTEFAPPHRQVHRGEDKTMRTVFTMELTPIEGATRLVLTGDLKPRWFLVPINAILWPLLMRKRARASMDRTLANIERIVGRRSDHEEYYRRTAI